MFDSGETVLAATQSDRTVRALQEALIAVTGLIAATLMVLILNRQTETDLFGLLIQGVFGVIPAVFVLLFRKRPRYVLTDRRVIALRPGADPQTLAYDEIRKVRRLWGSLTLRGQERTLTLDHLREVHLIEALIRERLPR